MIFKKNQNNRIHRTTLQDVINRAVTEKQLKAPFNIEYRASLPDDLSDALGESDIFVGMCHWTGKKLISLDYDSYFLSDEIIGYKVVDMITDDTTNKTRKGLLVIIEGDWYSSGRKIK